MQPCPPVDAALEADWVTLWQSELAALAVDREAQEQLVAALRAWAAPHGGAAKGDAKGDARGNARGDARGNEPEHELPAGRPGADAPPRPASAAAAPESLDQELDRLRHRIAELERAAPPA